MPMSVKKGQNWGHSFEKVPLLSQCPPTTTMLSQTQARNNKLLPLLNGDPISKTQNWLKLVEL